MLRAGSIIAVSRRTRRRTERSGQLSLALEGGSCALDAVRAPLSPRLRRGIAQCESPVERQLALALAQTGGFRWRLPDEVAEVVGCWEALRITLLSQVSAGPYRADFAVVRAGWSPGMPLRLAIEVDGARFHFDTNTQAERDRSRDRFLIATGATVIRFAGSEVWRDAQACAEEALAIAQKKIQPSRPG